MSLPTSPLRTAVPAIALAALLGAGLSIHVTRATATRTAADSCALPADVVVSPADRSLVTRRALACRDLEHGRITLDEYRAAIRRLDERPAPVVTMPPIEPEIAWAASVRDRSTEYSTSSWSAGRVLGPPDVHPASGDNVNAWASLGADDRVEYLEVALDHPRRLSGVQVFETYNPGAITSIELIGENGQRWPVYQGAAAALGQPAHVRSATFLCTELPVAAIRVTVDSTAVPGWNEIDAIGGVTCDAPAAMALSDL